MSTYSLNFKELSKIMGTKGNRELDNNAVSVRQTLNPVERDEANIEVEKGETVLTYLEGDPIPTFFKAGGERHSKGGTPLNLPPDSFVFSDTTSMKLTGEILEDFNKNPKKKMTPAEISTQYDINKYRKTLVDPLSDEIDLLTSELMISNNINKLGKLALLQEAKKGFPQGIPVISMPYVMTTGLDPSMFIPSEYTHDGLPMAKKGGSFGYNIPKAQRGYNIKTVDNDLPLDVAFREELTRGPGRLKRAKDEGYLADSIIAGMDFTTNLANQWENLERERRFKDRMFSGDNLFGPLAEDQDRGDYMVHSPYMLRPDKYTPVQFPGNLDPGMGVSKEGGELKRVKILPKAQKGLVQDAKENIKAVPKKITENPYGLLGTLWGDDRVYNVYPELKNKQVESNRSSQPKKPINEIENTKKVKVTPGFGKNAATFLFGDISEHEFIKEYPVLYDKYLKALSSNDSKEILNTAKELENEVGVGSNYGKLAGLNFTGKHDKLQDLASILKQKARDINYQSTQINKSEKVKYERQLLDQVEKLRKNPDLTPQERAKVNFIYDKIKTTGGKETVYNMLSDINPIKHLYNFTAEAIQYPYRWMNPEAEKESWLIQDYDKNKDPKYFHFLKNYIEGNDEEWNKLINKVKPAAAPAANTPTKYTKEFFQQFFEN